MIKTVKIYYLLLWLLAAGQVLGQEVAKGGVGQSKGGGQEVHKIRIEPSKAHGGIVSEYFEAVDYIPLETTKESLFGMPTIMAIHDNCIAIWDIDTWAILFFDLNGRFLSKYHVPKSIKQKRVRVTLEKDLINNEIVFSTVPIDKRGVGEIFRFSSNGKFRNIDKKEFENSNKIRNIPIGSDYVAANMKYYLPIKSGPITHPIPLIKVFDKNQKLPRTVFSLIPDDNPFIFSNCGGIDLSESNISEEPFFAIPYDHRFFVVSPDSIRQIGRFVFPLKNTIPEKILKSKSYAFLDSLNQEWHMNFNLVESVENIKMLNSKLLFNVRKRVTLLPSSTDQMIYDPLNFIYDTISKRLVSFERMLPDSLSYFLPIMDGFASSSGMNLNGRDVYSTVSSLMMFANKEKTKHRNPQYPPVLQKYFKEESRKSNPVIVRMKLRE